MAAFDVRAALAAFASACALIISAPAAATCPASEPIIDALTCSSTVSGTVSNTTDTLGGSCSTSECYTCGSPYANLTQPANEDVYSFTCQASGTVTMDISGMLCDLDIYILDDSCDPYTGCEAGSTKAKTATDSISFTCVKGATYYVVVEAFGYYGVGSSQCKASAPADYTLSFDVSAGTGCSEDCDNSTDDDLDGKTDCDDTDCASDPACVTCDADGDGYNATTCGGTDCDDTNAAVSPGDPETCNGVDDDCDGTVDDGVKTTYYRDADSDGYGTSATSTSACSAPSGYAAVAGDCNDSSAAIKPGATETCNSVDDDCDGTIDEGVTTTYYRDADGDGYGLSTSTTAACSAPSGYVAVSGDCNDASAAVKPGAVETCNSVDDDCDGTIDEGVKTTYYRDADGDGYGLSTSTTTACSAPAGYVSSSTDCNDGSATVHPGATETCNSIDDDCDGSTDEGVLNTYYRDADGDGYGVPTTTTTGCTAPAGYVSTSTDCNDASASIRPGATETCNSVDDDCDGSVDEGVKLTFYRDADSDGYGTTSLTTTACTAPSGYVSNSTDCNDASASINPGATESCNSIDDDCDGTVDDGVKLTFYRDADSDGYGTAATTTTACTAPSGYVSNGTDCNDSAASVNPGATETCNSVDDDCDGTVDEGVKTTYYRDADGDGYGVSTTSTTACSAPSGYVASSTDCNDSAASVNPGATETCNSVDDDCDGTIDEGVKTTYYRDADSDGYGNSGSTTTACSAPAGYVADSTDCNDASATIFPGATETCNSLDDDCDGSVDEGVLTTYYRDADSDGYGVSTTTATGCSAPAGYVATSGDCDDASAADNPGATEIVGNGDDDNCDGAESCYNDADGDKYGTTTTVSSSDLDCADSGEASVSTDCNDANAAVNPGATEACNGIDDDCDGTADDGTTVTFYRDADGDGYGTSSSTTSGCSAPAGYVSNSSDCDDASASDYPGATEVVNNGDDEDCDGVESCYQDADDDNYGTGVVIDSADLDCADANEAGVSTDCNDGNAAVNPAASETCNGVDDDCDGSTDEGVKTTYYRDADGDGYGTSATSSSACSAPAGYVTSSTDCNDSNVAVYPGATEACNSVDDDCDGSIDEGVKTTYYRDADGDGYGTSATPTSACGAPTGYVATSTDCDDTKATVYPGATESCNSVDDDCDGSVDEGVKTTYFRDSDSDGYGTSATTTTGCSAPTGYVASSTDCDDTKSSVYPGATETCNSVDDDCDGTIDEGVKTTYYRDADGDGYGRSTSTTTACSAPSGYVANSTDCDDTRSSVNPGATEYCNSRDDDCDGSVDEDSAADASVWYRDADGDGYGDLTSLDIACSAPSGFVANSTDCDDTRATVNPAATETCNSRDDDCDGSVDEGVKTTYYRDGDGDGYGNAAVTSSACTAPTGYVSNSTDCDDTSASVKPGGTETCNGVDDDCDGTVDEGVKTTYYADADADGYGNASSTSAACSAPSGYVANSTDCDDTRSTVNPAATEYCNSRDDDCDGTIDESSAADAATWYRDADSDAYGDSATTTKSCSKPSGYVADSTDCLDTDATTYPGATEVCDGIDNDCNGKVDDGATTAASWYADTDSDGYGDPAVTVKSCTKPSGYVNNSRDCDDTSAAVSPAATETCNGIDDDCDGTTDESDASDALTWYRDADSDGYGTSATTSTGCTAPSGYVASSTDCDDTRASVSPAGTETCNAIDDDCDGTIDDGVKTTYYADTDSDGFGDAAATTADCSAPSGYVANDEDCDDTDTLVSPDADELCNAIDDDCDGTVDEADAIDAYDWYRDADSDGYGNAASSTAACDAPSGYVGNDDDCNDANAAVSPADAEICNGIDDDCDGSVDESSATDAATWYADADSDGYGASGSTTKSCSKPSGYVADATDCDDADAAVNPAATEVCNATDDDCDGTVDEADAADALTWYRDADGDTYGDAASTAPGCDQPAGYVADDTDCDDASAAVSPAATEVCNLVDDDCDGIVDEPDAADASTWYADADDDGYGDATVTTDACDAPSGYVDLSTDCDDRDSTTYPGASEVAYDGVDQDCDGSDLVDVDGDGYVADVVSGGTDCDDSDETVYPGASEVADGVDTDCDGTVDETTDWYDDDGDGYTEAGGDCDDADDAISPVGTEACDGVDEDCDGTVDEGTSCYDDDADGFTEDAGDCNDGDADRSPGATEIAENGLDDDCDGSVDDGVYDPDGDGYTEDGGDCAPTDGDSFPGAEEAADGRDNDCDEIVDEGTEAYDDDGDGYTELFGDCDDGDAQIFSGADEIPDNGRDDDCDGEVDEDGAYTDDDGDGWSEAGGDCDDYDDAVSPDGVEVENGEDDDCDGQTDEGFYDVDGDGYGVDEGDCDDLDGWTGPFFDEMCDGRDNDCNGEVDENACEEVQEAPAQERKCGCATTAPVSLGWLAVVAALLAWRRASPSWRRASPSWRRASPSWRRASSPPQVSILD